MKLNKLLPFILVGAILIVLPLTLYLTRQEQDIRQKAAPATSITLNTTTNTVAPGQQFPVNVAMNAGDPTAGGNRVTGAELHMTYDATKFVVRSVTLPQNPLLPTLDTADTSVPGRIDIYLLSDVNIGLTTPTPGVVTGSLVTVTFEALSTTTAPSAITLTPDSEIAAIGEDIGTNVLTGVTPVNVSVLNPSPTPVPTPTPAATPVPTPLPTPVATPPTVSASLAPNPISGTAPLNGVSLAAVVSGTATGPIAYSFDCTNNGTSEHSIVTNTNPYTAANICNYPSAGTFTARVTVTRQGVNGSAMAQIMVSPASTPAPTPPAVTLTAPQAGTTVSGFTTISAQASGNVPLNRVEFFVDGTLRGTDTTAPYSISWDTTNGGTHPCSGPHTHSLTARVYDALNLSTTSPARVVNMNNPPYCALPTPVATPVPPLVRVELQPWAPLFAELGRSYPYSAMAYGANNLPIWSGITYDWTVSSNGASTAIGTVSANGNIATFYPTNVGNGHLIVNARRGSENVQNSIAVIVRPQPTPSPVQPGSITTINLISEGVDEAYPADQKLFNFILIKTGTTTQISMPGVVMAAGAGGIFTNVGTISTPPFVPGTYDVYVSGPSHLTKKFANVGIASGPNTLNLAPDFLVTGDIVDNNVIDQGDYNALISGFGCRRTPAYTPPGKDCSTFRADLDLDGRVSIHDYAYLVTNYTKQGEVIP